MWPFDWLFRGNKVELEWLRNQNTQLGTLNAQLKNELALSAGREGDLREQLADSGKEQKYLKAQLVNSDESLRIANTTIEAQQDALAVSKRKLGDQVSLYQNLVQENEGLITALGQSQATVGDLNSKLTQPYSPDIPSLLATMLKGDSAQALAVANKTLLAFNLVKALHAWRMSGKVVQYDDCDVSAVLSQLQTAFPGSRVLTWQQHEGVWIYPPRDGLYRVLRDRASLQTILESGFGVLMPYMRELFDCDDYARELGRHGDFWWLVNSLMYSESYAMQHAYVVVPLATEVVVVEAETNLIMSLAEARAAGYVTSDIYP